MEISGITVYLRLSETKEDIPIYKPEKINAATMAGFVPSEAGQAFEVVVKNKLVSGEGLVSTTFIDGREMQRMAAYPFEDSAVKGVYDDAGVRPFTFSTLQLKEDDGQEPTFDLSKLGIIEVQVCRAIITANHATVAHRASNVKASLDPVSEKAKKVGWHSVSLGALQPVKTATTHTNYIDQLSKPYAIFRFRYKPRELLEDEGIAPRIERPKQPTIDKQPSTGDKRPRQEENANPGPAAKRAATQENVKPEPSEGSACGSQLKTPKVEGAKKIKRERKAGQVIDLTNRGRSPIRVPVKGEVIDLSDD